MSFEQWAPRLAASLPKMGAPDDGGCVVVDYFKRYPIRAVRGERGMAAAGPLNGRYHVQFENGQNLALRSNGELMLLREKGGRPHLRGRFGVNEYVARVLDREANTGEPEAAKALAIAARTYLQQNAVTVAGCQQIADSSATQRVSPSPRHARGAGHCSLDRPADRRWRHRALSQYLAIRGHDGVERGGAPGQTRQAL